MVIAGFETVEESCATPEWQIHRARRLADDALVLVKLLQPENATPAQLASFRREYELLRTLHVPGVVKPLALVHDQGRWAMVLEDFAGRSLDGMLDAGKLDLQTGLAIATALAKTLDGLHAAGMVHKDIRPANFLVATQDAAVRLVDCRSATNRAPDASAAIDERFDLYALGVMLYRIFTGELPFHTAEPGLPSALDDVLMGLLAKRPEDRYQSARGVHFDLAQCLAQWTQHGEIKPFALRSRDKAQQREAQDMQPAAPAANGEARLDEISLLRASQAISDEILLDRLLKTLLSTMVENAGAQTGLLFLVREGELVLAAEALVEGGQVQASLHSGSQSLHASNVPVSVLDHVQRSRKKWVLDDASAPNSFSADDYLRRHAPKSVLCLPILRHGALSGLLYLENNLVTQA